MNDAVNGGRDTAGFLSVLEPAGLSRRLDGLTVFLFFGGRDVCCLGRNFC